MVQVKMLFFFLMFFSFIFSLKLSGVTGEEKSEKMWLILT